LFKENTMKSFFEFYEKLKAKKINEDFGGMPQNPNMMPPPGGAGGMAPPSMGGMQASPDMGGGMDQNAPPEDTGYEDDMSAPDKSQKNTAAPEGESLKAEEIYGMLDQISDFINRAQGKDDEDADQNLKSEMEATLDSLRSNIEAMTGVAAPSTSEDGSEEMGAEQPDEKGVGIDDASSEEMQAGGAPNPGAPAGGNLFPSQAGGSGDAGMGGGSAPMGNPGSGGGMFGM
jgi:hypothetical protein